jgi:hypothetical protein
MVTSIRLAPSLLPPLSLLLLLLLLHLLTLAIIMSAR